MRDGNVRGDSPVCGGRRAEADVDDEGEADEEGDNDDETLVESESQERFTRKRQRRGQEDSMDAIDDEFASEDETSSDKNQFLVPQRLLRSPKRQDDRPNIVTNKTVVLVASMLTPPQRSLVRYFQDACTTKPERTLYAESATWLATMVGTPCLVAALLAYSVALCVVGAAYFPNDDSAYLATAVVMGASAAVSVGAVLWVLVAKATARNAAPNPAAASGEVRFEPLHVCRMRQAAVFADRATFVVGFAQVRLHGGCPNSLRRTTHRGCVSGWCRPLQCSHA